MPENQIQTRIQSLNPIYGAYVVGNMPAVIAQAFAETYKLNASQAMALENGIQLLLLFFINEKELINFLTTECDLPVNEAVILTNAIILALPREIKEMYKITATEVFNNDLNQEILEAEALLNAIRKPVPQPPEAVYTSTQSAILSEARAVPTPPPAIAPVATTLPPTSSVIPSAPRWDTQQ